MKCRIPDIISRSRPKARRDFEPSNNRPDSVYTEKGLLKEQSLFCMKKARDGIRTRDPNLGKVVLHP